MPMTDIIIILLLIIHLLSYFIIHLLFYFIDYFLVISLVIFLVISSVYTLQFLEALFVNMVFTHRSWADCQDQCDTHDMSIMTSCDTGDMSIMTSCTVLLKRQTACAMPICNALVRSCTQVHIDNINTILTKIYIKISA